MDSSVNLDRAIFPYQDIRYTGRGTGAKPKVRKDVVLAPNFLKPKVPMPGSEVVPNPVEGDQGVEGDQNEVEPTSGIALCNCEGTPCSCGGTVCKAVGDDFVCPHEVDANTNTERSVVAYTPPVNRGKMCVSV